MKKSLFLLFLLALHSHLFCEIPESFKGIWTSSDRIIFASSEEDFSVILKLYYSWYYEMEAVGSSFQNQKLDRNSAQSLNPQQLEISVTKLLEDADAYELNLKYDSKNEKSIPFCIINNQLYLNFLIRETEITDKQSLDGFWKGVNSKSTFQVSPEKDCENVISWYFKGSNLYRLRYWQTKMDFDKDALAVFNDGESTYTLSRHIFSGGRNYTSTPGRGTRIRNVEKFNSFPYEYTLDSTGKIMALGKSSFSKAKKSDADSLLEIVKTANSRRVPPPPPLFPEEKIDYHWELIDLLEKDNKAIQELRERQKNFGARGKDSGN